MGRLSAQNQMYIGIAVIAVIAIAVTFLLIVPVFQNAADIDGQITTEQGNLATAQALLARRQSAKAQSAASEVELMRIANEVPDSPQLPSVIIEIQDLANAAGLDLQKITPSDMTAAPTAAQGAVPAYSIVPVDLNLRGDWADMIDFLRKVAKLNRGVRIVSNTFTYVPESDTEKAYIDARIKVEVYVMAAASGSAPSQITTPTAGTTAP